MDEIDWMKQFRKGFKYISIATCGIMLICLVCGLIMYIFDSDEVDLINRLMGGLVIGVGSNILFGITYGIICIINKLTNTKIDINFNKEYIRELYKSYPPAMVSYIYDLKIEVYRDYTATILYLFAKKYINISGFNEEVRITDGENKDFSNLMNHEKYVYDCVINKKTFNENQLNEFIIRDLIEKELIEVNDKDGKIGVIYNIIGVATIIISMLLSFTTKGVSMMVGIVFALIIVAFKNIEKNQYRLLPKGKQELKKIEAFKNYIKDYTLIKEKDIEHIQILEEYIPYSLSLGMSPQVEEYIKQNEIYRNLIYKEREKWT